MSHKIELEDTPQSAPSLSQTQQAYYAASAESLERQFDEIQDTGVISNHLGTQLREETATPPDNILDVIRRSECMPSKHSNLPEHSHLITMPSDMMGTLLAVVGWIEDHYKMLSEETKGYYVKRLNEFAHELNKIDWSDPRDCGSATCCCRGMASELIKRAIELHNEIQLTLELDSDQTIGDSRGTFLNLQTLPLSTWSRNGDMVDFYHVWQFKRSESRVGSDLIAFKFAEHVDEDGRRLKIPKIVTYKISNDQFRLVPPRFLGMRAGPPNTVTHPRSQETHHDDSAVEDKHIVHLYLARKNGRLVCHTEVRRVTSTNPEDTRAAFWMFLLELSLWNVLRTVL